MTDKNQSAALPEKQPRSAIEKIGLGLLVVFAVSIVMGLLNEWHPTMGLGSVLYFVIAGCFMTAQWIKSERRPDV
jgi:uncharacterized membrane protein YjgN (DUF898 family)